MKAYYHKLWGASNQINVRVIDGDNVYHKDSKGIDRVMSLDNFNKNYVPKKEFKSKITTKN